MIISKLVNGPGIEVSGLINTHMPYVNMNHVNPMQGMLRISGNDLQTFDGNGWINISCGHATINLDQDTQDLLQWARTQRGLQRVRATLIENNPALENAYKAILRAEQNFDILSKFVEEDNEHGIVAGYNFNTP